MSWQKVAQNLAHISFSLKFSQDNNHGYCNIVMLFLKIFAYCSFRFCAIAISALGGNCLHKSRLIICKVGPIEGFALLLTFSNKQDILSYFPMWYTEHICSVKPFRHNLKAFYCLLSCEHRNSSGFFFISKCLTDSSANVCNLLFP